MQPHDNSAPRTAATFAAAAGRYWLSAWPLAIREVHHWVRRAEAIPDAALRAAALSNLCEERGNLEGAAAFAVLAGRRRRRPLVTALVAFQVIYDYVDTLVEQPRHADPDDARRLHLALRDAVTTTAPVRASYYRADLRLNDGGYLASLVAACQRAVDALPAGSVAAPDAIAATDRMIAYQVLNHASGPDGRQALAQWSATTASPGCELRWWENAAAAASSLVVFALLAHAAEETLTPTASAQIAKAYAPVGALHVLLDSCADRHTDARTGDHSLVAHYTSMEEATHRLARIAAAARASTARLPQARTHQTITAAMAAYYLASFLNERATALAITAQLGAASRPALLILRARQFARSCIATTTASAQRST